MRVLLALLLAVGFAGAEAGDSGFTHVTQLEATETDYVVCASGADVVWEHPPRSDGTPDTRKLIVRCPVQAPGMIWVEGQPVAPESPLGVRQQREFVFVPMIGESAGR